MRKRLFVLFPLFFLCASAFAQLSAVDSAITEKASVFRFDLAETAYTNTAGYSVPAIGITTATTTVGINCEGFEYAAVSILQVTSSISASGSSKWVLTLKGTPWPDEAAAPSIAQSLPVSVGGSGTTISTYSTNIYPIMGIARLIVYASPVQGATSSDKNTVIVRLQKPYVKSN